MSDVRKVTEGAVTSISDSDLVMCAVGGKFHPISFANLRSLVTRSLGLTLSTNMDVAKDDWIRVAKGPSTNTAFGGILIIGHRYDSSQSNTTIIAVGGCGETVSAFNARNVLPLNTAQSFSGVRLVADGSTVYIEVKSNIKRSTRMDVSLCGALNFSLVEATVSTASSEDVLKTIDLVGGGG